MRGEELIEPWNMAVLLVCGVLGVYLALGFLHGWLIRGQQGLQAAPHYSRWCVRKAPTCCSIACARLRVESERARTGHSRCRGRGAVG